MDSVELQDKEIISRKTGEEKDVIRGTSINIENGISDADQITSSSVELSPVEVSKKSYYDSQKNNIEAKTMFVNVGIACIKIITAVITLAIMVLGIYWAYNLSNLAEPMGVLKEKSANIEKDVEYLKTKIDKVENGLTSTREEFIKINFEKR